METPNDAKDEHKRKRDINSTGSISELEKSPTIDTTPNDKPTKARQTKKAKQQVENDSVLFKDNSKEVSELKSQLKDLKSTISSLTSKTDKLSKNTDEKFKSASALDEDRI